MALPLVSVRDATPDDLPELIAMWRELEDLGSRSGRAAAVRAAAGSTEVGVLNRLQRAQEDPATRIVVATKAERVVGMAVLTTRLPTALFDVASVDVHYLYVRTAHRRRGVGRALVAAAAAHAEEVGAERVVTNVHPQLRDCQRFYARIGFGPMVVQRVASVAALRRALAAERPVAPLDGLLARRRSLRMRARPALARPLPR